MKTVKTRLEGDGFSLPADIRELKLYEAAKKLSYNNYPANQAARKRCLT
jgi:hypothetical protein